MLRFSYHRTDDGEQWNLCGELAGPWVGELQSVWHNLRQRIRCSHALVDLKEVTFIDEAGEQLLAEMQREGADFVATGVEHQHLLAHLNANGRPAVRRGMEHLRGARS